jgi:hypothetical protein
MPSTQNSPKVIKDKHIKQDCNNCLTRHWRNRYKYEESKKRIAQQKIFLSSEEQRIERETRL